MSVFLQIGKQRYCQGLPLLLSAAFTSIETDDPAEVSLELMEETDDAARIDRPSGHQRSRGWRTAIFEIPTDTIPEGTYQIVVRNRDAVSSPIMVLTPDSYQLLLQEENREVFDEELIPAQDAYRFLETVVSEYWTRIENPALLLGDPVIRSEWHRSLRVSGQIEGSSQISASKLRYGAEAFLSDMSYLATITPPDEERPEPPALDIRVDDRGNVMFYGRAQSGVREPQALLYTMQSLSDLAQLPRFHTEIFKSRIDLSGTSMFELFLTVAAESEIGRRHRIEVPELESPAESVAPASEYSKG